MADGAGWLADLPAAWISPTAYQLDHFHGKLRIAEVARDPTGPPGWWAWVAGRFTKLGIAYDPAHNGETTDSITIPGWGGPRASPRPGAQHLA